MHFKKHSKLATLFTVMGLSLATFCCPISVLTTQAAVVTDETVDPCADDIQWRYTIMNNKIYKRLFNYSTNVWIGDWIYVCDVEN